MRRIALRDLRHDDGLSLVEVVVSLMIFGIIATALASSVLVLTHVGYTARVRQFATALAQQTIETNRAVGAGSLAICQSANPPSTYNGSQTAYSGKTVVTSTAAGCLPYQQTTNSHGVSFTVTNWVVQVGSATSAAGFLQYEKALIVVVSWTNPSPGGSYTANTLVQNGTGTQSAGTSTTPTILTVNAQYYNTSTSTWTNITGAQGNAFDVTVTDPNNNNALVEGGSGTTGEGTWSSGLITPGNYTCTVTAETGIQGTWTANDTQPGTGESGSADGFSVSGPCTVTSQQTVTFNAYWTGASSTSTGTTSCPVTSPVPAGQTKRNLVVDVIPTGGTVGHGIAAVPVYVNDGASGESGPPGAKNTDATGHVVIPIPFYGPIYFGAEPPGDPANYQWSGQQGPVCIQSSADTSVVLTLPSSPTPTSSDSQVYVAIVNQDTQPVKNYKVTVSSASGTSVTGTLSVGNTTGSGGGQTYNQGDITLIVPNGTGYTVTVSAQQTDGGYNVLQTYSVDLADNGGGPTPNKHSYDYTVTDLSGGS